MNLLEVLPNELLLNIFINLSPPNIYKSIVMVQRKWKELCNEQYFYKNLFEYTFNTKISSNNDFKSLFINKYCSNIFKWNLNDDTMSVTNNGLVLSKKIESFNEWKTVGIDKVFNKRKKYSIVVKYEMSDSSKAENCILGLYNPTKFRPDDVIGYNWNSIGLYFFYVGNLNYSILLGSY